jgi:hypothetical protein
MSLNSFVSNITESNVNENNNNLCMLKTDTGSTSRLEIMDDFLNSQVVDKYNQPWRNLTKFLKKNRMKQYLDSQGDEYSQIEKQSILRRLSLGKIENKCVEYNPDSGEIVKLII